MPGRYSHSVVLADYSSRGVISLPDEQRAKYVTSSPQYQESSVAQPRARGTRSAQAVYSSPARSRERRDAPVSDRSQPSLATNVTISRPRVNVPIIDASRETTRQSKRYSQTYEQIPRSAPAVNVINHSEPKIAYGRNQQHHDVRIGQSITYEAAKSDAKARRASAYLSPDTASMYPAFHVSKSNSNSSLREDASVITRRRHSSVPRSGGTSSSETLAPSSGRPTATARQALPVAEAQLSNHSSSKKLQNSIHAATTISSDGRVTPEIWRCPITPEHKTSNAEGRLTPEIWRCPATPEHETRKAKQEQLLREQVAKDQQQASPHSVERLSSNESKMSRHTQVLRPQQSVLEEPDFDGFSDLDVPLPAYFDGPKRAASHSRDSSQDSTLIIQRPESRSGREIQARTSEARPVASPQAPSTRTTDPNTPSRTTPSSTIESSQGRRSNSSVSSVSMPNGYVQSSKNVASPRKDVRASGEKAWRLPEISENHGFSPSIFEDHEGNNDSTNLDVVDAMKSIGQISSGKDVTFDDAASELSAALPPPITRFKDDEDEFNANMAKLFGEGGDNAISKGGSHFVGRSTVKKEKRGFFAKLRSKSQPPRK